MKELPSIKNVRLGVIWDGDDRKLVGYASQSDMVLLSEGREELARLKAVMKDNEAEIEHRMQIAIDALVGANEALKRDNADLHVFLTANKKLSKALKKAIMDTVGSVGGEWD